MQISAYSKYNSYNKKTDEESPFNFFLEVQRKKHKKSLPALLMLLTEQWKVMEKSIYKFLVQN